MGLELVGILMTVEEKFGVIIPETEHYETVAEFAACIERHLNPRQIRQALVDVKEFESQDFITHDDYVLLAGKYPSLPPQRGFFKKKPYTTDEVVAILHNQLTWSEDTEAVLPRLKEILSKALSIDAPIEDHHHLIKDLGCG